MQLLAVFKSCVLAYIQTLCWLDTSQAVQARLDALEADNDAGDDQVAGGSDDEDFMIAGDGDSDDEGALSRMLINLQHFCRF